jgi:hypothetical protein
LNPVEQVRLRFDHPAAHRDPARRCGADNRMAQLRQSPCDPLPHRMIGIEFAQTVREASLERRA